MVELRETENLGQKMEIYDALFCPVSPSRVEGQRPCAVSYEGGFQVSSELYETRLPMTGPGTTLRGVPSAVETQ